MNRPTRMLLTFALSTTFALCASAQQYPDRVVKIIVPFSAGSAADIVARRLAQGLTEVWKQGVVVENVAGAGGNIGASRVAKSPGDGYTLMMVGLNHAINPSLYKDPQYDLIRDFKPISQVAVAPMLIVASPSTKAQNLPELLKQAKATGQAVTFGSGGNGSITHLVFEMLKADSGISLEHVPYKSVAPMMTAVMANEVTLGAPAAASAIPQAKAGLLKILATTGGQRTHFLPDVPTVAEAGLKGFDVATWNGLMAPAATPDNIVQKIAADVAKVAKSPEFVKTMNEQAMDVSLIGPQAWAPVLKSELDKWAGIVRRSGARID